MIISSDWQFEGGLVVPYFISVSEEDEGQDEKTENDPQYVRLGHRLSTIIRVSYLIFVIIITLII